MKIWKRWMTLALALVLTLSLAACGKKGVGEQVEEIPPADPVDVRLAALKGPTGMGIANLTDESGKGVSGTNTYTVTLAGAADEVTPLLIKGELDMACVPANLASVLYNKTEGELVTLAINTLGVIYIVENGNSVENLSDLKGRTIVAAGKGSTPEYALRYLLRENGMDPDLDLIIDWKSEHSECVAALASGAATVAMLPQPFVTVATTKIDTLRIAFGLTEEWEKLNNGSAMLTGVVVARKAFVEEHPEAVKAFLTDYAAAVEWVNSNAEEAAAKIGEMEIVDAAVAEKALPYCNIVCISGEEMQEKLSGYLQVLFDAEPASVGGKLPASDFYFVG
ncbi:MAG: ABC transporter substrate-binding protein [Oscillibacter sp.]|nr:ABC transporter substrate-binding protein [Oscillibacter sp.]